MGGCGYNPIGCPELPHHFSATPYPRIPPGGGGIPTTAQQGYHRRRERRDLYTLSARHRTVYIYINRTIDMYKHIDYHYLQDYLQYIGYERFKICILLRSLVKCVVNFLLSTEGNIHIHFRILLNFLFVCVAVSAKLLFRKVYSSYRFLQPVRIGKQLVKTPL